ncbi:MAG TPA: substrate-binding domain-containing protein [Acidobacteriaceae bacterium]|jgi:molybdate transport system substrate-binding protein
MNLGWSKAWGAITLLSLAWMGLEDRNVTVMISGAFSAAYKQLGPGFEQASHEHLQTVYGPSMGETPQAIPVRLSHGENADVIIVARSALDALAKNGQVVEGSQVDLVRSQIGMAVRAGSPVPDISSVKAFTLTLLRAKSVAYSDSASGVYIATALFKRLGIEKEMAVKSRKIPAEPVGQVVARGEAEIGFQQMSELKPVSGITIVGRIPEEVQLVTVFSAGVAARSTDKEAARGLIQYLASPSACPTIEAAALEPIACATAR